MNEYKYTVYVLENGNSERALTQSYTNQKHEAKTLLDNFKKRYCTNCHTFEVFERVSRLIDITSEFEEKLDE